MKKILLMALLFAGTNMYAEVLPNVKKNASVVYSSQSFSEKIDGNNKEKFFYNKGFADGFQEGRKAGYEQAMKEAKEAMKRWAKKIKSYESGKYLASKGKITPPRVYQKRGDDGSVSVVIRGCRIEGELSPEDILTLPTVDFSDNGGGNGRGIKHIERFKEPALSDSVFLAGVDRTKPIPIAVEDLKKVTYRYFSDTGFYRKLMRKMGKPFSIQSSGKIKVMFESAEEANSFMTKYNLDGEDYR